MDFTEVSTPGLGILETTLHQWYAFAYKSLCKLLWFLRPPNYQSMVDFTTLHILLLGASGLRYLISPENEHNMYRIARVPLLVLLLWALGLDMSVDRFQDKFKRVIFRVERARTRCLVPTALLVRFDLVLTCGLFERAPEVSYPRGLYTILFILFQTYGKGDLFALVCLVFTCIAEVGVILDVNTHIQLAQSVLALCAYGCLYTHMVSLFGVSQMKELLLVGFVPVIWVGFVLALGVILCGAHLVKAAYSGRWSEAVKHCKGGLQIDRNETLGSNLLKILVKTTQNLCGEYHSRRVQSAGSDLPSSSQIAQTGATLLEQNPDYKLQEKRSPEPLQNAEPSSMESKGIVMMEIVTMFVISWVGTYGIRVDTLYLEAIYALWLLFRGLSADLHYEVDETSQEPPLTSDRDTCSATVTGSSLGKSLESLDSPPKFIR